MRPATRRRALVATMLVLVSTGGTSAVRADDRKAYRRGLAAIEREDWKEGARWMQQAAAENPRAGGLFSGRLFQRYLPHYYLGLALAGMGACREAIGSFDESERQGKVKGSAELYQTLQSQRAECRARVSEIDRAADEVAVELTAARSESTEIARLAEETALANRWSRGRPSLADRLAAVTTELTGAEDDLDLARRHLDRPGIEQAARRAAAVASRIEELRQAAATVAHDAKVEAARRREEIQELLAAARKELARATDREPAPPDLASTRRPLEQVMAEVEATGDAAAPELLADLRDRLMRQLARFRNEMSPPPAVLRDAAAAYFAGDFTRTVQILEGTDFRNQRSAAHACLLRVAARWSLARLAGADGEQELAAARAELVACRRADPSLAPSPDYFPPGFRRFYASGGPR